ncbi:hypothetical protein SAMN05444507_107205 [Pseudomonas syringae]|nr:hypothetical protein SAMN05444507_107205 [Pseudomonas syringae]
MKDQNHSANLQMAALRVRVKRLSLTIIQRLVEKITKASWDGATLEEPRQHCICWQPEPQTGTGLPGSRPDPIAVWGWAISWSCDRHCAERASRIHTVPSTQHRTRSVQKGMPTRSGHNSDLENSRFPRSSGNACRDPMCHAFTQSPFAGCDAAQQGHGRQPPDDLLPGASHRQTAFRATCHWRIRSCRRRVSEAPAPTVRPRQ